MASNYLRPLTNTKRVKLVSTCDNCKGRKVRCDKERPECGTCKKTRRPCSYKYAELTETMRDQQGLRSQPDSTFLQNQLNYLQGVQFGQLFEESGFLAMATRVPGVDAVESMQIPGMLARPLVTVQPGDNTFSNIDGTSVITAEVLQNSINTASNIQRTSEQCQYDPTYFISHSDFAALAQQVPEQDVYPSETIPSVPHYIPTYEDTVMNDLTSSLKNLKPFESSRYVGEGSLLMLDDDNNEMIIPIETDDLSVVDDSLKVLPNTETVEQLIQLYFMRVHRYFPVLRAQVIWDALGNLSKPQHLLLLNCIFFVASPFHDDPDKQDGKIYFDRAEELLYEYCIQPHVLTVMSIIILSRHNKQAGTAWSYHGIATKMLFELGLHRKYESLKPNLKIKMNEDVERLRNDAFWMTFISENFVSTTYGRPNMIDETDCNIDVPKISSSLNLFDEQLEIAYINLINLSRIGARVRKYLHASRLRFLMQDDQNKFRVLDAALASWLHALPQWLKFEEIMKDPYGTLLNGVGGDMHIFYRTIIILLHGRYLKPPDQSNLSYFSDSSAICMKHAIVIVHTLEILLDKHREFFALAVSGKFAINPAMRVFAWHAKYEIEKAEDGTIRKSENCKKSEEMMIRLETIRDQILKISQDYDRGRLHNDERFNDGFTEWLGIYQHRRRIDRKAIIPRDWELCIADNDKPLRKQYSSIAKKQSERPFMIGQHSDVEVQPVHPQSQESIIGIINQNDQNPIFFF
ncbi:9267_t:CDS:2 [Scutellospora calospora]|uniref:9267_t:CDS:1 n=1 Tax=Scutellospora calospora TaxID=85575 RepID=A0ACA9K7V7_9GLOM|nr:9267_t:CDS:2 [Scutellospora calospora]